MWVFRKRWAWFEKDENKGGREVWQVGYYLPSYELSDCLQGDGFEVMYEESSRLAASNIVSRLNGGN